MVMWRLKSCPRCGGDMFIGKDDNWFQQCIQCAHRAELKNMVNFEKELVRARPEKQPVKVGARVHAVTKG